MKLILREVLDEDESGNPADRIMQIISRLAGTYAIDNSTFLSDLFTPEGVYDLIREVEEEMEVSRFGCRIETVEDVIEGC